MEEKEEHEIKKECMGDLDTAIDIIGESNHPEKGKIGDSINTVIEFCERWWET